MKLRLIANLALFSTLASGLACSASGDGKGSTNQGDGATSSTGATSSAGGTQPILNTNGGTGPMISVGGGSGVKDPNDPRDVPVRQKTCDITGTVCTCLRLALVGTLDSSANAKDTKPFIDWLNGNSGGTATVTMVATKPTVDATFLANYDILVIANVNGWTFSAEEKAAVEKWVREMGGGIVTLTGFNSMAAETAATSQLVAFAGMGYSGAGMTDWTAPAAGATTPIYYKGGTVDLRNCLNLWSNAVDKEASQTTAIKFMPQTGPLEKLTASLDYVGAYIGWPVNAPAGSTVIATDPMTGKNMAVALEVDGKGRILSFGDEWIVFTNQWQPTGTFTDMRMDAGNMCWQPAAGTEPGFYQSVKSLYQTKQFWYNIINWVAPPSECNFTIDDPDVVVK
jgi:hypothetical protein